MNASPGEYETQEETVWKLAGAISTAVALYLLLLCFPQPFFHSSAKADNLTLYSDQPFSPEAARQILELVGQNFRPSARRAMVIEVSWSGFPAPLEWSGSRVAIL